MKNQVSFIVDSRVDVLVHNLLNSSILQIEDLDSEWIIVDYPNNRIKHDFNVKVKKISINVEDSFSAAFNVGKHFVEKDYVCLIGKNYVLELEKIKQFCSQFSNTDKDFIVIIGTEQNKKAVNTRHNLFMPMILKLLGFNVEIGLIIIKTKILKSPLVSMNTQAGDNNFFLFFLMLCRRFKCDVIYDSSIVCEKSDLTKKQKFEENKLILDSLGFNSFFRVIILVMIKFKIFKKFIELLLINNVGRVS
jgi:hypothetical protein